LTTAPRSSGSPNSRLSPLAYEREREAAAGRLGCRVSILDRQVAAERGDSDEAGTGGRGRPLAIADVEPWPDLVGGAALLDALAGAIGAMSCSIRLQPMRLRCGSAIHTRLMQHMSRRGWRLPRPKNGVARPRS
jgi:hypothetical protein